MRKAYHRVARAAPASVRIGREYYLKHLYMNVFKMDISDVIYSEVRSFTLSWLCDSKHRHYVIRKAIQKNGRSEVRDEERREVSAGSSFEWICLKDDKANHVSACTSSDSSLTDRAYVNPVPVFLLLSKSHLQKIRLLCIVGTFWVSIVAHNPEKRITPQFKDVELAITFLVE